MLPMASDDSVTVWITQLKAGDREAAQHLWERYFQRLVGLARKKLRDSSRRVADEEDVALSAFDSFCRGAERGRFDQLQDRDNLWPLLVLITSRKAADQIQHQLRKKRGGGMVEGESVFLASAGAGEQKAGMGAVLGQEPTPAFAAEVAEEYQRLLGVLVDAELQKIAQRKIEGYTNEEIAAELDCVPRTVERKLRTIRSIWDQQLKPADQ
jgi:DNA-directed RNA polymerase specialized sigma24 family protein